MGGAGDDGELEIAQNHCPIAAAARCYPDLCAGELALFRCLLGSEVRVTCVEHLLSGDPRCVCRIREQSPETGVR